jgi:hypothetical protein
MAAAVIDHLLADGRGHVVDVEEQLLHRLRSQVGMGGQGLVQFLHIGGMVLAVVDLHRGFVILGLQGVGGEGERGKDMGGMDFGHGRTPGRGGTGWLFLETKNPAGAAQSPQAVRL